MVALPAGTPLATTEGVKAISGSDGARRPRAAALAVLLAGAFVGVLDPFVVTVALPVIREDLGATFGQTQWMVAGYGAAYAVSLVCGGRLGDLYGRRRLFVAGTVGYALASAAAGSVTVAAALVPARIAQGLAAAAMLPQVLSIIRGELSGGERSRAIGWYGSTIGIGVVCGPALGGLLVAADVVGWGWRTVFLVNVPLGLAIAAAARFAVRDSRAPDGPAGLDVAGVGLSALAMLALLVPVTQGPAAGWPWWTVGSLVAAPVLIAAFLRHERRVAARGGVPLLPLRLFAERRFAGGLLAILLIYTAGAGAPLAFLLTYHLQEGLGLPALDTGLVLAPLGLGFALGSAVSARLTPRWGLAVPAVGTGVVVAALAGIALVDGVVAGGQRPWLLAPTLLLAGLGQGATTNPVIALTLDAAPEPDVGSASGVLLTTTQVANILGVTVVGSLFFALLDAGGAAPAAFSRALAWSLLPLGALFAAVLLVLPALRRPSRHPGAPAEVAGPGTGPTPR